MKILRGYEQAGFTVYGVFLYREEWIKTDHAGAVGGPYEADRRILSSADIRNVREAIAGSDLACRDTLKIFQLLVGRVKGQRGDSWFFMDDEMKTYLEQFDGIGTECHTVDSGSRPGRETLKAQAELARWTKEKDKECPVFMGGGIASDKRTRSEHSGAAQALTRRTITNRADGRTMEVELIDIQHGKLVCRAKGRRFYIPLSALTDDDIEFLKKWIREKYISL